jgi:hypothetical protein
LKKKIQLLFMEEKKIDEEESPQEEPVNEEESQPEAVDDTENPPIEKSEEEIPGSEPISEPVSEEIGENVENIENEEDIEKELMEFADLENLSEEDLAELQEMQEAISENIMDTDSEAPVDPSAESVSNIESETEVIEEKPEFNPEINAELEARMQAELAEKKKSQGVKTIDREAFINYLSERRNKIVYHALWHMVFNVDDHSSTKAGLYEALKDVTSKNPVEPLGEHKFYFGLGFILRLKLYDAKVIEFKKGKLTVMINIENLSDMLEMLGPPISDRPILTKSQRKDMFSDFLSDDFLDI